VALGDCGILKTSCVASDAFDDRKVKRVAEAERYLVKCPLKAGSVIVSRMNGNIDLVGACGYVWKERPNVYLPDRLWQVSVDQDTDGYFVYLSLIRPSTKAHLRESATGTSTMKNIPQSLLLSLAVALPTTVEQAAIGAFFTRLDDLITLHQRECRGSLNRR